MQIMELQEGRQERPLIPTQQGQVTIDGRRIDIVCSIFSNRIFLVVSECQKLGTLMEVNREPLVTGSPSPTPLYSVRTLLGKDQPEVQVFGRALAAALLPPSSQPSRLLLSLALTSHPPHFLPPLLSHVKQYKLTS